MRHARRNSIGGQMTRRGCHVIREGGCATPRAADDGLCHGDRLPAVCTSSWQAGAAQSSVGIMWQLGDCMGEASHARVASRGLVEGSGLETEVRSCWELCVAGAISPDSCPTAPRASGPVKRVPWASYHERLDLCVGHVQRRGSYNGNGLDSEVTRSTVAAKVRSVLTAATTKTTSNRNVPRTVRA